MVWCRQILCVRMATSFDCRPVPDGEWSFRRCPSIVPGSEGCVCGVVSFPLPVQQRAPGPAGYACPVPDPLITTDYRERATSCLFMGERELGVGCVWCWLDRSLVRWWSAWVRWWFGVGMLSVSAGPSIDTADADGDGGDAAGAVGAGLVVVCMCVWGRCWWGLVGMRESFVSRGRRAHPTVPGGWRTCVSIFVTRGGRGRLRGPR